MSPERARLNCAGAKASHNTAHVESICPVQGNNFLEWKNLCFPIAVDIQTPALDAGLTVMSLVALVSVNLDTPPDRDFRETSCMTFSIV